MNKNNAALLLKQIIDRVPLSQSERQEAYQYINTLLNASTSSENKSE